LSPRRTEAEEVVDDVLGPLPVFLGVGLVDVLELEDVLAGGAIHL